MWVAPYILIWAILLLYAYFVESNPFLKRNRLFTNLVFIPPILFGLTTNFILRSIGIEDIWRFNTLIVLFSFVIFIISIFRYGLLELKITVHGYHLHNSIKAVFNGSALLNHKFKNDLAKIQLYCQKISNSLVDNVNAELQKDLLVISNSVNYLQETVSDFKSRTSSTPAIKDNQNLNDIIEGAIISISPYLQNIEINKEFTDFQLFCDHYQMKEVFIIYF